MNEFVPFNLPASMSVAKSGFIYRPVSDLLIISHHVCDFADIRLKLTFLQEILFKLKISLVFRIHFCVIPNKGLKLNLCEGLKFVK
jgi:hypothetical protein